MAFLITCVHCNQKLRLPESALGKRVKCSRCGETFRAEAGRSDAMTARPPAPVSGKEAGTGSARVRRSPPEERRRAEPDERAEVDDRPFEFKAVIKRDPDKSLKGAYQARVTPRGLRLTKAKKDPFLVPVGTPVTYLGGNRLALTLDGREVEVHVTKFRSYQQRLARDVAAFLKGKKQLDPGSYAMEWYLLVPAALPLGIPIITLGGALPAALGCGLAGGCYAIAQKERWPVGARIAASLALAGIGYVAVIALVGLTLLLPNGWGRPFADKPGNEATPDQQGQGGVAGNPAAEEVLPADAAPPDTPLRCRATDTFYQLSHPRVAQDQFGRPTLFIDFEKTKQGEQDGVSLIVHADDGSRRTVLLLGPMNQTKGVLQIASAAPFGPPDFPKNMELYLTHSDPRYGPHTPQFKVSNSVTVGTMPRLTPAREWTKEETALLSQPPPNYANANAHPKVGVDTPFAGHHPGGGSLRFVEPDGLLLGVEYRLGEWEDEKCLGGLVPIFSRDQPATLPQRVRAQEGYAVGGFKVQCKNFVDALQVVFMRVGRDGRLDPADSYASAWLGYPGKKPPSILGGDGTRVIGIHCRQGAILNDIALVRVSPGRGQ
ncbi:MAG TPA: hypothetical protein VG013_42550 [Gemmataceae bacterium]|nr:hypothetical protein [Gemmataceae bacterium]